MAKYIVYRGGSSNAYNSLGVIGVVYAVGEKSAKKEADSLFPCYNGQYLFVKLASKASNRDNKWADEKEFFTQNCLYN